VNRSGIQQHSNNYGDCQQISMAERLCAEVVHETGLHSILEVLTRHGSDSAFLVNADSEGMPFVIAGAREGMLIPPDHPLPSKFQQLLQRQCFVFRHYVTCGRCLVTNQMLRRYFPGQIQSMLALDCHWREAIIIPFEARSEKRNVICFFSVPLENHIRAMLVGAVRSVAQQMTDSAPNSFWPQISRLQHVCMHWAVKGKTAKDIAVIENMSVATVRYNLNGVKKLLGCSTLSATVVEYSKKFGVSPL
jgi:DNA-binding CsgD family transcriptional regulator